MLRFWPRVALVRPLPTACEACETRAHIPAASTLARNPPPVSFKRLQQAGGLPVIYRQRLPGICLGPTQKPPPGNGLFYPSVSPSIPTLPSCLGILPFSPSIPHHRQISPPPSRSIISSTASSIAQLAALLSDADPFGPRPYKDPRHSREEEKGGEDFPPSTTYQQLATLQSVQRHSHVRLRQDKADRQKTKTLSRQVYRVVRVSES